MATDSLNRLREVFDGLHREAAQNLKATNSQLVAAEARLKEYQQQETTALARLDAVNKELHAAEADLKAAKLEASTLRSAARGEADNLIRTARREAINISTAFNEAVRAAALNASTKPLG
jgi:chromosome segregation ATPase